MRRVRPTLLAVLALCGLVTLLFLPLLLGSRVFYERDLMTVWYPQVASLVRSWSSHSWPLWDPWVGFGQPLLALPDAQVAYPFAWLRLVLPPPDYYVLFATSHLVFSGVGLFLLLRQLGLGSLSSLAGAGTWIASGPLVSMVNLWHHFASSAWIPWVLLAASALQDRADLKRVILLAVSAGLQILAGSADMTALTLAFSALIMAASPRRRSLPGRSLVLTGVAWVLALLIAAIAWMPAAAVARESARWDLPEGRRVSWAVHPLRLPEIFSPVPFDDLPLPASSRLLLFDEPQRPFLKSLYLGLASVGLGLTALLRAPTSFVRWPWLAGGMGCLLVSLGQHTPVYSTAVRLIPPLAMLRYPSKAMVGVALSWAVLCALGLEVARRGPPPREGWPWRVGVATAFATLLAGTAFGALLLVGPAPLESLDAFRGVALEQSRHVGARVLGASLAGIVVVICVASQAGATRAGHLAAAIATVLDLALSSQGVNRHAPRSLIAFRPPLVNAIAPQDRTRVYIYDYGQSPGGKTRRYLDREFALVAATGGSDLLMHDLAAYEYLPPPLAGRWGIEGSYDLDLRGLQPQLLADLNEVLRAVEGSPLHLRLLRMGAVSRVVALHTENLQDLLPARTVASLLPEPIRVFDVPNPQGRTYAVGQAILRSGRDEIRALLQPDFDPTTEVVLSGTGPVRGSGSFSGTSTILAMRPDQVTIQAELSRAGFVVLADAYDPGWRATVDGSPAPVLRANAVFRAVAVPAGQHRIEMRYRPAAATAGLAVSGLGLIIVLSLVSRSVLGRRAD